MESTVRVSIIANPGGVIFSSTWRRCNMADPTRKLMKLSAKCFPSRGQKKQRGQKKPHN